VPEVTLYVFTSAVNRRVLER